MTIDFTLLNPDAAVLFKRLIDNCAGAGVTAVPYYGIRTLEAQAKLWRQSRPTSEINAEISSLRKIQCDFLADVLEKVGPQPTGRLVTNAIPGLSWHNWGEAMDCYILVGGKANWQSWNYGQYGISAKAVGLRWGGDFSTPDWGHVQMNQKELNKLYPHKYINDHFKEKK